MRKQWGLLFTLIFTLIVVLFSIANEERVSFSYIFGYVRIPLIFVIIGSVLIGAMIVGFPTYYKTYRQKHQIRRLERQIRRLAELHPEDADKLAVQAENDQETEKRPVKRHSLFRR